MKNKIFIVVFLVLCSLSTLVQATGQIGEKIIIGRDTLWMLSCPLKADTTLSRKVSERLDPKVMCTALWRGYIGTWRLENETLYLEAIHLFNGKRVNLDGIFDAYLENGRIAARWFSGEIRVVRGEQVYYEHMGFAQYHEHETIYSLCDGVVTKEKEIYNSLKKSGNDESDYTLDVLFNGKGMTWEGDSSLNVQIIPKPDGTTGQVKVLSWYRYPQPNQDTICMWGDFEIKEKEYDENHPYVQEIKRCLALMDDWNVLTLDGKIQPVQLRVKWGRDRSAPYKYWLPGKLKQLDSIEIDGRNYVLIVNPLQQDPDVMTRLRPRLKGAFTTRNPRGYVARWKIADGCLWLTEIRHGRTGKRIPLSTLVHGNHRKPVVASWYSGSFKVDEGDPVGEEYPWAWISCREIVFEVKNGEVVWKNVYDNYIQPGDTAAYNQFIRTIRSHDWDNYRELQNRVLHVTFMVYPNRNGVADSIREIRLDVYNEHEARVITDPTDPWVMLVRRAVEVVPRWEVRFIKGEVQPLEISFDIKQFEPKSINKL